jgi:hypothetical protein
VVFNRRQQSKPPACSQISLKKIGRWVHKNFKTKYSQKKNFKTIQQTNLGKLKIQKEKVTGFFSYGNV